MMKPLIDRSMFREAMIDSGALATRSSIIHRLEETGMYKGRIYRGTEKVGKFTVNVSPQAPAPGVLSPGHIKIDLAGLDTTTGAGRTDIAPTFIMNSGGVLIFYVSTGSREYSVKLYFRDGKKGPQKVFDSQVLQAGDVFVTHVMRPGVYQVKNTLGKGSAELTVEYPGKGKNKANMEPAVIECAKSSMNPKTATVQSVQPLMIGCTQDSRITIELTKADDRPCPAKKPAVHRPVLRPKRNEPASPTQKKIIRTIKFFG